MTIHKILVLVSTSLIAMGSTCGPVAVARPPCQVSASAQVAAASVATVQAGVVAVPFAVPVAMPSYVQYSSYVVAAAPEYQSHVPLATTSVSCAMPAATAAVSSAAAPTADVAAPVRTSTLIAAHCGQCHGPVQPKAGLDLSGTLDDATRLKAITRILTDDPQRRMPKGKELSAVDLGGLIQELATSTPAQGKAEAPPVPGSVKD